MLFTVAIAGGLAAGAGVAVVSSGCQAREPNPSGTSTYPSDSSVYPYGPGDTGHARRPVGEAELESPGDDDAVDDGRGTVLSPSTGRRTVIDSRESIDGAAAAAGGEGERVGPAVPNGSAGHAPASIDDDGAALQGAGGTDIMQDDHATQRSPVLPADILVDAGPGPAVDAGEPGPGPVRKP